MDTMTPPDLAERATDRGHDRFDRPPASPTPPTMTMKPAQIMSLSEETLIGKRWRLGVNGRGEVTSSFYFGIDGRIKVFKSFNEASWRLENGELVICDIQGVVAWVFQIVFQIDGTADAPGQLLLVSGYRKANTEPGVTIWLLEHRATPTRAAAPVVEEGAPAAANAGPEAVRMVIWDLDDTFWSGTLSEGAVQHNARNAAIVQELNRRGIVSAICSKNDRAPVEAELRAAGLWDRFVFREIAFAPKGAMVARIVSNSQLRASTVIFIDDNVTNLNEAKFYSPGLQIAEPDILDGLLDDPRFAGKPDPDLQRLERYRVLERKLLDQAQAAGDGGDNFRFLRDSDIRVSLHTDVEAQFARIHDLVNRTNQLNYTKKRWPDDIEQARAQWRAEFDQHFVAECGYVKVADRYGSYGICGFYLVSNGVCTHMLFSCRAMNMGVEQFVWTHLGRPYVPIQGEVIADIDGPSDWVRVVADADVDATDASTRAATNFTVAMFGACNMTIAGSYLRQWFQVHEETQYPYHDWGVFSLPRIIASAEEASRPENQALLARLPGMPAARYESCLIDGSPDAFVLSFSSESFCGHYRSRSTGLVIPMVTDRIGPCDFSELSYHAVQAAGLVSVSADQWAFMQEEFDYLGKFDPARFAADVRRTFEITLAHGKPVVLIGLNESVGNDTPILELFGRVNAIANSIAARVGIPVIDVARHVRSGADLTWDQAGHHYQRHAYVHIAEDIKALLQR